MLNRERWQSLEPLLDEVLELAPTARTRWLGELAARSPGLAAELTTLLGGEDAADQAGFLSGPCSSPAAEVNSRRTATRCISAGAPTLGRHGHRLAGAPFGWPALRDRQP